ncbi:NAD(P)-binding protein [Nocardia terpenica]|uniref:NAD(P)/FAD-dependent oxidoreductase n=1 Tax=Nocardia terpenica TaxID=455432 RepID=UPI002FE39B08
MQPEDKQTYDVAIVGGGVGGSALAAILARHGVRVLIVEGGGHPRFAIGESTVPETTIGLRVLARRYDVPEIANLANNTDLRHHVSSACGVKRNFSFAYHREGEPFRARECTQYPTWGPPLGPDSHFFRQDVDAYLYSVALSYGATGRTHTPITGVEFDSAGAELRTGSGETYRAAFVVDAGGMRSVLADVLDLRIDPPYRTRSRAIYSHFVGVQPFDRVIPPRREHGMPSPLGQGTLHHLFEGGWMWVIPFDNHVESTNPLCSVGINLDIDRYPRPDDTTAEQEFWTHVERFPTIARQLAHAKAVRPYIASTRSQFASRQVVGPRWCMLPHASDFIDPLFSSGLAVTVMALNALAHRIIDAVRADDYAVERFDYLQTWTKRMFDYYDALVFNSYTAFDDFELWNAWNRVWTIGTLYGATSQIQALLSYERRQRPEAFEALERAPYRGLQAIDNPQFAELFDTACAAMADYRAGDIKSDEACGRIYDALGRSGLVPRVWGTLDPADRCPAGTFTLPPMHFIHLWGKHFSPAHVRGSYFTQGISTVVRDAAGFYAKQVGRNVTALHQSMRDMWINWNQDWQKVGGPRR